MTVRIWLTFSAVPVFHSDPSGWFFENQIWQEIEKKLLFSMNLKGVS